MMLRKPSWVRHVPLLAAVAVAVACGPKVKPGLKVNVTVDGNDRPGERARRILLTFDRAMVADAQLGKAATQPPVKIEPEVAGTFRWRESRVLVFDPAAPLPRATRFTVKVVKGTHAPDGFGLTEAITHSFETERLTLATQLLAEEALPSPDQWAVPDQRVRMTFNLPVAPTDVQKRCAFTSKDDKVGVTFVSSASAPAESFEIKPSGALALDTSWTFACEDALAPVEGPLGLAAPAMSIDAPAESPDGRAPRGTYAFRTFGPFKVESMTPTGTDADPDTRYVVARLSNPAKPTDAEGIMSMAPAPEHAGAPQVSGTELLLHVGNLAPKQRYTVKVPAGLQDVFGQKLSREFTGDFTTGSVSPRFDLETGSWSVESQPGVYRGWARNVPEISVITAAVPPERLFDLLGKLQWWDDEPVDLQAINIKPTLRNVKVEGAADTWNQITFDPKALLGAAKTPRFVYLAASAPSLSKQDEPVHHSEVLLNVTDLGVTSKLGGGSGQVWVTRLSDGRPQGGADVIIRDRTGAMRWRGRTDAEGLAKTPGLTELIAAKPAKPAPGADAEDEEGEGDWEWQSRARLLVFAQLGDDITFVDPEKTGTFAGWNFSVPVEPARAKEALRGFMHTDRGLYRPGETVSMRGLVRKMTLGRGLGPVTGQTINVRIANPKGEEVFSQAVKLSRYGSWNATFTTGQDVPLGDYAVTASLPEGNFTGHFQVEEFRANTFEVKLQAPTEELYAGDALKLLAEGRYYYGAPVRAADLKFAIHGRSRWVHFADHADFTFEDTLRYRRDVRPYGVESFWDEEEAKLAEDGKGSVDTELPRHAFAEPTTLLVSATVQDESNQAVTAHLTVPVHPARFYLGLDTGGWMAPAKERKTLRFLAVNAKGQQIATKANLIITRHKWSCAFEAWGYRGSYRCSESNLDVVSERLSLTKDAPTTFEFTPPEPGEYWVRVEGFDRNNTRVQATSSLWVWGEGESAWSVDESGRFEMVADKAEYAAGDVARLLPKTQVAGASALVTIEREGVIEARTISDLKDGQAIEVPIADAFAPNVYVSVMLSRGRTQEGSRGLPKMTMAMVNLPVAYPSRHLAVAVNTDKPSYRPGEVVTATIKLTDQQGKPVRGEVALSAADEGVLSLINFATPDPMERFYSAWALGVLTASQLERLAQVPQPGEDRYMTGGDAAGAPGTFRARFRATAYWNPAVETDDQGHARVSFEAPDNLTAFRLMAVAADAADRFGHADQRFTVNKPLQLMSALPRFASVGDAFDAAVVLMNETGKAGSATVNFEAEGLKVAGPRQQTVALPVGGRARVAFPVAVTAEGIARVRFAARMGGEQDGLEQRFPLQHPTPAQSSLLSAGDTTKETRLAVTLPEGVIPGTATIEMSLDPDGLAGIEESLRDLISYPYGCLEQTTSRLIPLIAVEELARQLGIPDLEGPRLQRYIRIAIEKIGRHQNTDGGFSLWPGGVSEPYLTAFALWGLKLSQDAAHAVNVNGVNEALAYLKRSLEDPRERVAGVHDELGELGSHAFALYVLELYKQGQPGAVANLYERRNELPYYGLAFMARALAGSVGVEHQQVADLVEELERLVAAAGDSAVVKERQPLPWYMSSDVRTSAIIADALLALHPRAEKVPALVRGLLKDRRGGAWRTTQENLYALVALTNYAKANAGRAASVVVRQGDHELLNADLSGKGAGRIRHVSVRVEGAQSAPLVVLPTRGQVFYQARLRYRQDAKHQAAVGEGFALERAIVDPATGAPLAEVTAGDMVRVRLSFTTPEAREYVALTDWLPAGLEPINARFATSADAPEDETDWRHRLWGHSEMHDERVSTFSDWVYQSGTYTVQYLARATSTGNFVWPSATVEEMYTPEVRGRVALSHLRIVPKTAQP